jgi:hypothetical protein
MRAPGRFGLRGVRAPSQLRLGARARGPRPRGPTARHQTPSAPSDPQRAIRPAARDWARGAVAHPKDPADPLRTPRIPQPGARPPTQAKLGRGAKPGQPRAHIMHLRRPENRGHELKHSPREPFSSTDIGRRLPRSSGGVALEPSMTRLNRPMTGRAEYKRDGRHGLYRCASRRVCRRFRRHGGCGVVRGFHWPHLSHQCARQ